MYSAASSKVSASATTSLAGCFGCHMSFLNIDERLLELVEIAEFDRTPLTDIKHCSPCDIALIEGGVCNSENVAPASGNCAPTPRSWSASGRARSTAGCRRCATVWPIGDILRKVYADPEREGASVPNDPELQLPLDKVYPINEIVASTISSPVVRPSGDAIWKYLTDLIRGRMPRLEPLTMHYD